MRPAELRYRHSHEWVKVEDDMATIGITDFAVSALTDLVYLQFSVEIGEEVQAGDAIGEIESVKAVSDIYTPVSGEILEINSDIGDRMDDLAKDPFGKGWLCKIRLTNPSEVQNLMSAEDYEKHIENSEH